MAVAVTNTTAGLSGKTLAVLETASTFTAAQAFNAGITGTTLAFTGNSTIGGTLGVTGATTLSSTLAVTGAVSLSSTLAVTGASTLAALSATTGAFSSTLAVTGATTLSGTTLTISRDRTLTGAMGQLYLSGKDAGGNATDYAFIYANATDTTDASEDADLYFNLMSAGALTNRMILSAAGLLTVNDIRLTSSLQVGGSAARATTAGTNRIDVFDGTAPVGTLVNGISLYSTAGECRVMDAAGNATLLSPHDRTTNDWIYDSVDTRTGKRLRIEMEQMMRRLDAMLGGGFIEETV